MVCDYIAGMTDAFFRRTYEQMMARRKTGYSSIVETGKFRLADAVKLHKLAADFLADRSRLLVGIVFQFHFEE